MQSLYRLLLVWILLLVASPAFGQFTRDKAANQKIDEALNQHYLTSDFDGAERILRGTITACEQKCAPATLARAWMYVGIVRGSGHLDQEGARVAFESALGIDPNVSLDTDLATAETRASFEALGQPAAQPGPTPTTQPAPAPDAAPAAPRTLEGMSCSPAAIQVETRRPIPIACSTEDETTSMSLRYLPFGSQEWVTVNMQRVGGYFQTEIPCTATEATGPLRYLVLASDATGAPLDNFGSKSRPIELTILGKVNGPPPSFPGKPPPARCRGKEICPPDFPGCGGAAVARGNQDWGASCDNSTECKPGLLCQGGVCETAPSCLVDADCDDGVCRNGRCDIAFGQAPTEGGHSKNLFGIELAADLGFVGGDDVCQASNQDFECYLEGTEEPYPPPLSSSVASSPGEPGDAYPGAGIKNGLSLGTVRVLASYDRALSEQLTLGGRLGFAFRGGPSRDGDPRFLPVHAEVRAGYFFLGLGAELFRPYVHLGVGMAQVDLKHTLEAKDCSTEATRAGFLSCVDATGPYDSANDPDLPTEKLDAYRKLGRGFVSAGGGTLIALGPALAARVQLNAMILFPDSGLVLEPSLGGVYAF